LNIQTERIDNHQARITVEVEPERWEKAKKQAARGLSRRYKIPGFRKGKAPYHVIERYIGESPIIEEAMEKVGNEVYRQALEATNVIPYDAGNLEDFKLEPQPTYVFTLPLAPEVVLSDYRSVRVDYEEPEITDEDVKNAMRRLQQQEALVEEKEGTVAEGDLVTLDIHSEFADGEERSDDDELDPNDPDDTPKKGDDFIHRHDMEIHLDPELEPIMPGFIDALAGAEVDDELEFELSIPDDDEDYDERVLGRKIYFEVTVKDVKAVTLPEMNDDFAARVTDNEEEPLTLLELRMRMRENLQNQARQDYHESYTDNILAQIVEDAERIDFPEVMVEDRIDDRLEQLDRQLREQSMTLDMYKKMIGVSDEELRDEQRDAAIEGLKRSLVLSEVLEAENITASEDEIESQINEVLQQFGEQADAFRQFFDTPQQRQSITSNILYGKLMERLVKIGKGEPIEEDIADTDDTVDTVDADAAEPVADVEADTADTDAAADTDEGEEDVTSDAQIEDTEADSDDAATTEENTEEEPAATKTDD
jgi:trigger factor